MSLKDHFQFHQGLSTDNKLMVKAIFIEAFNSIKDYPISGTLTVNITSSAFNSIKDYRLVKRKLVSSLLSCFQFHQGLSTPRIWSGSVYLLSLSIPSRIIYQVLLYLWEGRSGAFNSIKDYLIFYILSTWSLFAFNSIKDYLHGYSIGVYHPCWYNLSIPSRIIRGSTVGWSVPDWYNFQFHQGLSSEPDPSGHKGLCQLSIPSRIIRIW